MDYTITSLFSPLIFESKLEKNYDDIFEELKSNTLFVQHASMECYVSTTFNILDDYQDLKSDIMRVFNFYKNDILKYEGTEFKITTSWLTKVRPGGMSHYHNHKNCMYSGVLYFEKMFRGAPIEFTNTNLYQDSFMINQPSERNCYNSNTWHLQPEKNTIIIFPSYLMHRVGTHQSDSSRYSLAFNLMPDGYFGYADSTIRIENQQIFSR